MRFRLHTWLLCVPTSALTRFSLTLFAAILHCIHSLLYPPTFACARFRYVLFFALPSVFDTSDGPSQGRRCVICCMCLFHAHFGRTVSGTPLCCFDTSDGPFQGRRCVTCCMCCFHAHFGRTVSGTPLCCVDTSDGPFQGRRRVTCRMGTSDGPFLGRRRAYALSFHASFLFIPISF